MSEKQAQELTSVTVYYQARAVVSMGREYPTSMCNNDPRLMMAACVGVEDALRFKAALAAGKDHAYPTEAELLEQIELAIKRSS